MNGRVYDPVVGRFVSPDPWIQDATNSQSFNRYTYVWNNPLRYTDPTGEITERQCGRCSIMNFADSHYKVTRTVKSEGSSALITVTATAVSNTATLPIEAGTKRLLAKEKTDHQQKSSTKKTSESGGAKKTSANLGAGAAPVKTESEGDDGDIQKIAYATLDRLRENSEFSALEKKYGALTLSFDDSEDTGLTGNNININESTLSREYRVDIDASINAFQDALSASLSDSDFWVAIDSYSASLPKFQSFSMERILTHEAYHLMQGDVSGLKYNLNKDYLEGETIGRTNSFMYRNFREPYRVPRHGDVR